ncbi:Ovarian tumor, otubain [Corchorus olitorius]|uniref:ubiquitinyl hydrolase 1 n=1 Tax=Corchorus olitorius TaxID=93759 RepID=A0A1R3HTQ5_9ROSI|nr:Ovarian tumor, otubain [Corchorus olitorius]
MYQYQQDSDLVHWFLEGDPFYQTAYNTNSDIVQHDASGVYYHGHYYRGDTDPQSSQIENDEVIARALQEEFSNLALAETSQFSHDGEQQFQASSEPHDWHSPPTRSYYYSGYAYGQDESDDLVPTSSCSSPSDSEDCSCSLELTDGYLLDDDEVGKRLNQMIPIPHVPRINGEIPSIDEAMSDHERLLNRLQTYGFVEHKVPGDGNCQFRALSDQLYQTPDNHKVVRRQVVNQLKSHRETYEGYVPMDYDDYLKKMSKSGEWGDHVTLQAAADSYGKRIFVITSFKDTCYIEILPNFQKSKGVIFLSFWAEVHYNSIYFEGDQPSAEVRRKKKWWNFGN